ncbi:MAG: hypothetical protein GWN00_08835 [Aliifodinibius sp.]|nr:hypothetical protein [Fodinibius sp.]NIV11290.1 hypothetical protein [Fodinibius sp.]NIY24905.1 hypothetical protein [Fodinibius sp.]
MKSKMLLALAGLLMVSVLFISPICAQSVTYRANGTLDGYNPVVWFHDNCEIVVGGWTIKIYDDSVDFKAWYLEENILEEIPGTLDKFRLSLTDGTVVGSTDGTVVVQGTIDVHKIGWDPATGKPKITTSTWAPATITIDTSGIEIDIPSDPDTWEIGGITLSIRY